MHPRRFIYLLDSGHKLCSELSKNLVFFKVIFLVTIHNVQKIQTNQFTRTVSLLRHSIFLSLPPSLPPSLTWGTITVQSIAPHPQPPSPVTATMTSFALSCVQLFVTPWTVAHQNPLSLGFFRQGNWSGLPFPTTRDLSDPGIEPVSLTSALQGGSLPLVPPGKPKYMHGSAQLLKFPWASVSPPEEKGEEVK